MSAPTIKAIDTVYAGHRFRSRLEARWAVAFDTLAIRWEYEPQGVLVDGVAYLPDFHLPGPDLLVEVKGQLDLAGAEKVMRVGLHRRIALLGQIPAPATDGPDFHVISPSWGGQTNLHDASLLPSHARGGWNVQPFGWPSPITPPIDHATCAALVEIVGRRDLSTASGWLSRPHEVAVAYDAARQARFEHGESGRPRSHYGADR